MGIILGPFSITDSPGLVGSAGPGFLRGWGLLCILRNRKEALLRSIIRVATSPVAVINLGSGFYVVFSPAFFS